MPRTAKVQAQLDKKIELDDEPAVEIPVKAKEREKVGGDKSDKKELQEALRDLLIRLGSRDIDDLKQMTFMSLRIRDPLAKGMAYYGSTIPTIEKQCNELLDWYIEKCQEDILQCVDRLKTLKANTEQLKKVSKEIAETQEIMSDVVTQPEELITLGEKLQSLIQEEAKLKILPNTVVQPLVLTKRTFWEKIFRKKVVISPELESFNASVQMEELTLRLEELKSLKAETEKINVHDTYFMTWAYNYLLNCRSQSGDDNFLKMMVMLTDGQIVNKQESSNLDPSRIFTR